jgi:hypothetical protein
MEISPFSIPFIHFDIARAAEYTQSPINAFIEEHI